MVDVETKVSPSSGGRPVPLLSSLIQTRSVELVLAPIASQVSQLMILTQTRGGNPLPDLESNALSAMSAVQHMVDVGERITAESPDEMLKEDLPIACARALRAGQHLVETARILVNDHMSVSGKLAINVAAQGILEGTMQVLLVWDEAEVRKIVSAAHWTLDRLGLTKVAKSMRSLVVCFGGLAEAMAMLLSLADKRQKDLTNMQRKERILAALTNLKISLPPFCEVMKKFVRDPNDAGTQSLRNIKANQVSSAIHELIRAVSPLEQGELVAVEPDNMVTNIMQVHRKLAPDSRYFIGPDLDRHLDAILQNSMAVAQVSRDRFSQTILQLCNEVLALRKKLGENLTAVTEQPNSLEARAKFDETAEFLCEKLCEIDSWVADAVVDQITEVFVEPSAPVNNLVQAAAAGSPTTSPRSSPEVSPSSSPTHTSDQESDARLTKQVELFRRHSRRLSQVASHAAQSSADSKRVQLITDLAKQVDEAMPKVVEAALALKRAGPGDMMAAKAELDTARKEWAEKVQQLTAATDDIVDPEDFLAVSEDNIHQDMTKCRDAVKTENWHLVRTLVQGVAAKSKRVAEIGKMATDQPHEVWKKDAISTAVSRLEQAIPNMVALADEVLGDLNKPGIQENLAQSLKEVLDSIHVIQSAVTSDAPAPETPLPSVEQSTQTVRTHEQQDDIPAMPPTPPPPPSLPPDNRYIGSLKRKKKNRTSFVETDTIDLGTSPVIAGNAETQTPSSADRFVRHEHTQTPPFHDPSPQHKRTQTPSFPDPSPSHQHRQTTSPLREVAPRHAQTQTPPLHEPSPQHQIYYPTMVGGASAAMKLSPSTTASPPAPYSSLSATTGIKKDGNKTTPSRSSTDKAVQTLVSVAKKGEVEGLQSHVTALQARTNRLTSIAEMAVDTTKHNPKLMKILRSKAQEVNQLTPKLIRHAEKVARNPKETRTLEELQLSSHQWAGHVSQLIEATQKANYPWSKAAEKLVTAAKTGKDLEIQKKHVSTQTNKMVDVAMVTVAAAETEEAIGSGSGDDTGRSLDQEVQERIKHVRVTASEIQKLTPQLLEAADMALGRSDSSDATEHLNLLSQEWATKAKVLMRGVDAVSLGMSGPADSLLLSARSGDPTLLTQQGKAITELASSINNIAQDALEGCEDTERAEKVKKATRRVSKVSEELISAANRVAQEGKEEEEEEEESSQQQVLENLHETLENTELLRRDWASQVHLITAHIDALTAKVSAPLDRLVEIALQASRTQGKAKQLLLEKFEKKSDFILSQLEVVESRFNEATEPVEQREAAMDAAALSISFLKKLHPHVVGACRSLTSEPGSAMLEHFTHLKRQWATKAQKLLQSLKKISTVDMEPVLFAFAELIQHSKSDRNTPNRSRCGSGSGLQKSYSFEDITAEEGTGNPVVRDPWKKLDPHKRYSAAEEAAEVSRHVIEASKRPASIATPLPSWSSIGASQSIAVAAQSLRDVAEDFHEEGNIIIKCAKKMSEQMAQMAEFSHGRGVLQSKAELINTAKAIAANGNIMVQFANLISEQCTDQRMKANLLYCAETIPTLSTQLRILASVKASTPSDVSADVMLVKNAENLMQAVIKTMQAAEAACMKGLKPPEDGEQKAAFDLVVNWKHRLYHRRTMDIIRAPRGGPLGLRKYGHISTPSLIDVLQPKTAL